jgi:hypothetical protein
MMSGQLRAKAASAPLKVASVLSEAVDPADEVIATAACGPVDESEEDEPQPANTVAATITDGGIPELHGGPFG